MDYIELTIEPSPRDPWVEIVIAALADYGFDSFVETETGVQAYGPVKDVNVKLVLAETILKGGLDDVTFSIDEKLIPHQNWNALWESDFKPVEVDDYLTIVAPFHSKEGRKGMIVEIQPQMSFGTGHHETTFLMSKMLFELDEIPAKVLDMGTGTGVLAIIAEKLGAKEVLAIDIEDWSVENTIENAQRNNCKTITALCGDQDLIQNLDFRLILANINKNVLKAHMESYSKALGVGGDLLLSGFFISDVDELVEVALGYDLTKKNVVTKDGWACIHLIKK